MTQYEYQKKIIREEYISEKEVADATRMIIDKANARNSRKKKI
ncbi:hypothetical protein [Cytobacillus horneckiae]